MSKGKNTRRLSQYADDTATVLACLITPLVPGVIFGIASLADQSSDGQDPWFPFGLGVIVYLYALLVTGILGLPAFLVARHFGIEGFWVATIAAFLIGLLLSLTMFKGMDRLSLLSAAAASGGSFWLAFRSLRRWVGRGMQNPSSSSPDASGPDR